MQILLIGYVTSLVFCCGYADTLQLTRRPDAHTLDNTSSIDVDQYSFVKNVNGDVLRSDAQTVKEHVIDILQEFFKDTDGISHLPFTSARSLIGFDDMINFLNQDNLIVMEMSSAAQCISDMRRIGSALKSMDMKGELWAFQLLDSYGKLPSGVLDGNFFWPGSYDQCRSIEAPQLPNSEQHLNGQYCLVHISKKPASIVNPMQIQLSVGICVPNSCSTENITSFIDTGLIVLPGGLQATVKCHDEPFQLSAAAIIVICFLSIYGFILMVATMYDLWVQRATDYDAPLIVSHTREGNDTEDSPLLGSEYQPIIAHDEVAVVHPAVDILKRIARALSVYRNGTKLFSTAGSQKTLGCLHGIRFISMSWVILGHSLVFNAAGFANVLVVVQDYLPRFTFQAIAGATVSVDTFFLLSGLLVAYLVLGEIEEKGGPRHLNWLLYYLHRYWRLTIPFIFIMVINLTLVRYMGDGPTWNRQVMSGMCQEYWWRNILYIQSLFPAQYMCMAWTWYLSLDMIYFWIAPLMLIPLYLNVVVGLSITMGLMLISFLVTGFVFSDGDGYPVDMIGILNPETPNEGAFMNDIYMKPWCRIGPYLVGILVGYLLFKTKRNIRIHWSLVVTGWIVSTALALSIIYGLYGEAHGHQMNLVTASTYNALHRTAWALCVSWVIFACITGNAGFINTFLSWSAFIPVSRVTYMAYLVHPIVMTIANAQMRVPLYANDITLSYLYIGHLVTSYGCAFVLTLAFESPLMSLEKEFIKK